MTTDATAALRSVIAANRAGHSAMMPSICTAHRDALLAAVLLAGERGQAVLIEATSNQVNQHGGYTGMRPADFRDMVHAICDRAGVDRALILLGGDHLGPQVWRRQPAEAAMRAAETLVAGYVAAGFRKIHLDCSEGCSGEPAQMGDGEAAARAARLARICEDAAEGDPSLVYVIGTEVPPPGGARAEEHGIVATTAAAARRTLAMHHAAFEAIGIGAACRRIVGLVVQPGVEFAPMHVDVLPDNAAPGLIGALDDAPGVCFEAHSTDYQPAEVYPRLANMGFAIQKVGPALTFAYRRALYALADALAAMGFRTPANTISARMEALMLVEPSWWQGHYHGTPDQQRQMRHFSFSDRIRYYWPYAEAQGAVNDLFADLVRVTVPDAVLRQYFPAEVMERGASLTARGIANREKGLVLAEIQHALLPYFIAPMGDRHAG